MSPCSRAPIVVCLVLAALTALAGNVSKVWGYAAIVNSIDHTQMHIVPAPGAVAVDGDLADWDLSGAILMKLDESSQKVYSVRGAMMFNDKGLYVGAEVRDPTPMLNNYSFSDEPGMAWNADAIQIRFVSDPAVHSSASLQSSGQGLSAEDAKHVCHLTLWYSTRNEKAGFYICYTLGFSEGQLNPPQVAGAYRKLADGQGYSFEYFIPWAILRAPRPLVGGDQVQLQWQMHWGMDLGEGLRCGLTDVRNPASGDLGYMGPGAWGRGIFEKSGKLAAAEKPTLPTRPQGHIPLEFSLEKDSQVSLAIYDRSGQLIRTGLGAQPLPAGKQQWLWDGLTDRDEPVAPGKYSYKLLVHPGIAQKYVCDIGVTGNPPYQSEDGRGGWAGDYASPQTVAVAGARVLLGTASAEAAPATICTDLDGNKIYGTSVLGASLAVADGKGYMLGRGNGKLVQFDLERGFLSPFRGSKPEVPVVTRRQGDTNDQWIRRVWLLRAVAVLGKQLVVSSGSDNLLILLDRETGKVQGEVPLEAPFGLASDLAGALWAVSGNRVGRYDLAAKVFHPVSTELDNPRCLAVDAQGNVFVSLQGQTQQVWKLSPQGQVVQKIGKAGGRPALGRFDPEGMLNPEAIAVDGNGRLWVCEADNQPKRYSLWNADGSLYKQFLGSLDYSTRAWVDEEDPQYVYAQAVRYKVDYEKGSWQVDATLFRASETGKIKLPAPSVHAGGALINLQGRKFVWIRNTGHNALYELVGEKMIPRLAISGDDSPWWVDSNNDGQAQEDEYLANAKAVLPPLYWGNPIDGKLGIYSFQGERWAAQGNPPSDKPFRIVRWKCLGFNDQGGLKYGPPAEVEIAAQDDIGGRVAGIDCDDAGNTFALVSGGSLERGTRAQGSGHRVESFGPDGKLRWQYHNVHCAFAWTSENYFPGYVVGAIGFGQGSTDDLLPVTGYYGQYFLLDKKDGLFVTALGEDQRSNYSLNAQMVLTENFNGTLFRHAKNGKTYMLGGDADCRLWELSNLEQISRKQGSFQVSSAQASKAQENARGALAAALAKTGSRAAVVPLTAAAAQGKDSDWLTAKVLPIVIDAQRQAVAQLGYDQANLYARIQVRDSQPLKATPTDYKLLFKAGAAVEIQLGSAAPPRDSAKPLPGDLRLIVSRLDEGKFVATLYRPRIEAAEKPNQAHFQSPTGKEDYDEVIAWNDLPATYLQDDGGYTVVLALPWKTLGITPAKNLVLCGDVGVIYGNKGGTRNAIRYLWADKSPEVSINNDIPSEVRIHPKEWGVLVLQ